MTPLSEFGQFCADKSELDLDVARLQNVTMDAEQMCTWSSSQQVLLGSEAGVNGGCALAQTPARCVEAMFYNLPCTRRRLGDSRDSHNRCATIPKAPNNIHAKTKHADKMLERCSKQKVYRTTGPKAECGVQLCTLQSEEERTRRKRSLHQSPFYRGKTLIMLVAHRDESVSSKESMMGRVDAQ